MPRSGATAEDDGWIMGLWGDAIRNTSELVILNAQDFDGAPAARIKLDHRVTNGFHGSWVSQDPLHAARTARLDALAG